MTRLTPAKGQSDREEQEGAGGDTRAGAAAPAARYTSPHNGLQAAPQAARHKVSR
ncbi:hypothetical protein GCM10010344_19570 [Streptomyces bluensis]|nr:hypothetical protein GCM10010344_19570 [Streptomyces bluensis]